MRPSPPGAAAAVALVATLATAVPARATGEMMPDDVTATVSRHHDQIRRCFRRASRLEPALRGKLTVRFRVGTRGRAVDVTFVRHQSTLRHPGVEQCVARVFRAMRFRRFAEPAWFRSPLIFTSA